ncbi:hypothetical protein G9C98_001464 [Cotesia typhae]|uniref:NTR domain-containing protein n=1 Tax=Cotesia typhae TaxID=2053667 RepID=A0A8J5V7R2_9HYME|nr:hypothetical protein G9C98_001464 [Cotesia typhae]
MSLVAIHKANACGCMALSLEKLFCDSDFVIKVKIEDIGKMDQTSFLIYTVNILETYKATDEAKSALQYKRLPTYSVAGSCGLNFQRDEVVVVGGNIINGQPSIGFCHLHIQNSGEIEAQEINLRENFIKSCVSV